MNLLLKLQVTVVKSSLMIWKAIGWYHRESPGHCFEHISSWAIDMWIYFPLNMEFFLIQPIELYRH